MFGQKFTEKIIPGQFPDKILTDVGLVLEGGGTRAFFSAGVLEAFMESGIMFPHIVGVSAGSANAMSYVSGQKNRNKLIVEKYVGRKEYVSLRNMAKDGSVFGMEYVFRTIPSKHIFWDKNVYMNTDIEFLAGALDINDGEVIWYGKNEIGEDLTPLIASCSVPVVSPIIRYKGRELLDGGVSRPIPIEKSVQDGMPFHVIVLTRNKGYQLKKTSMHWFYKMYFKKYPKLWSVIINRDKLYNSQLQMAEDLEQKGKALIIRPQKPMTVKRLTSDPDKLLEIHEEGLHEGRLAVEKLAGLGLA